MFTGAKVFLNARFFKNTFYKNIRVRFDTFAKNIVRTIRVIKFTQIGCIELQVPLSWRFRNYCFIIFL